MSYIERALYWYLKNKVFGGFKKLKLKEFAPFTFIIFSTMALTTILVIFFELGIITNALPIQTVLLLELFIAISLIVSGVIVGRVKNRVLYFSISFSFIIFSIVLFLYGNLAIDNIIIQHFKLIILLLWILISSISLFVLILYFFTSFSKKVITLGIPKDHLFFDKILFAVLYISIPFYAYMIYFWDIPNIICGILGMLNVIVVLILLKRAPKNYETIPGVINYATAIGFFYIIMFYHLVLSFSTSSKSTTSIIIDLFGLLISLLYIIQSLTRRVSDTPEKQKSFEVPVVFQSRLYLTDRLKKLLGEPGLVLIIMGLAMGYHMIYLDSFFNPTIPLLSLIVTPDLPMSAIYHRIYLIISLIIILLSWRAFHSSARFKEFMTDKYNIKQVFKYFQAYFQKTDEGISPFEFNLQNLGNKFSEGMKNLQKKVEDTILGKKKDGPQKIDNK